MSAEQVPLSIGREHRSRAELSTNLHCDSQSAIRSVPNFHVSGDETLSHPRKTSRFIIEFQLVKDGDKVHLPYVSLVNVSNRVKADILTALGHVCPLSLSSPLSSLNHRV